jgi:ketosteroid isomerase-like protein
MMVDRRRALGAAVAIGSAAGAGTHAASAKEADNLSLVRRYVEAAQNSDSETVAALLADDYQLDEQPNALNPNGQRRNKAQSVAASKLGQKYVADQRYDITRISGFGELVIVEATWSGRLKEGFGKFPAGLAMKAECAMILTLRDGRIVKQHEYDCYYPFA